MFPTTSVTWTVGYGGAREGTNTVIEPLYVLGPRPVGSAVTVTAVGVCEFWEGLTFNQEFCGVSRRPNVAEPPVLVTFTISETAAPLVWA
jgi:hypothetical protein